MGIKVLTLPFRIMTKITSSFRKVIKEVEKNGLDMHMKFQVADVKKPLVFVKRIMDQSNSVRFGPTGGDSFIASPSLGYRLPLRATLGGSYMLDITFPDGSVSAVTVDSGAEENLCPKTWGIQFGIQKAAPRNFRGGPWGSDKTFWIQRGGF